jgi:hypothetical protein
MNLVQVQPLPLWKNSTSLISLEICLFVIFFFSLTQKRGDGSFIAKKKNRLDSLNDSKDTSRTLFD